MSCRAQRSKSACFYAAQQLSRRRQRHLCFRQPLRLLSGHWPGGSLAGWPSCDAPPDPVFTQQASTHLQSVPAPAQRETSYKAKMRRSAGQSPHGAPGTHRQQAATWRGEHGSTLAGAESLRIARQERVSAPPSAESCAGMRESLLSSPQKTLVLKTRAHASSARRQQGVEYVLGTQQARP